jgi:mono/diheme cytochrome c family protein
LRSDLIAAGEQVYAAHCAACHGANLEGQPNWKTPLASGRLPAPPHDDSGHTWHHDDALLKRIIVEGGNGSGGVIPSDMPAFGDTLTAREVESVLELIKSRWSPDMREYQWRMTVESAGH